MGLTVSPTSAQNISGNTVTTNLTVKGSSITLNNNSTTSSSQLRFNSTTRTTSFWLNGSGTWVWSRGATPTDVMALDSGNVLSLYDLGTTSVNPAIILNPGNPSATPAIAPSITVGGKTVLTSSNAASILGSQGYLQVVSGVLKLPSTNTSTSSTTGALTVAGGIGISKDSYFNGVRIGRGAGSVFTNTALGITALATNGSIGEHNTAVGYSALRFNSMGQQNTAMGVNSLRANTSGSGNSALGMSALLVNTPGASSTAIGFQALMANKTGSGNTAFGKGAGAANTTGAGNLFLGSDAGASRQRVASSPIRKNPFTSAQDPGDLITATVIPS